MKVCVYMDATLWVLSICQNWPARWHSHHNENLTLIGINTIQPDESMIVHMKEMVFQQKFL